MARHWKPAAQAISSPISNTRNLHYSRDVLAEAHAKPRRSRRRGLKPNVGTLHDKIEQTPRGNGDAFSHLEHRIAHTRGHAGRSPPIRGPLAPVTVGSAYGIAARTRIEQRCKTPAATTMPSATLEDRIVHWWRKLDASDSRLSHLEGIERRRRRSSGPHRRYADEQGSRRLGANRACRRSTILSTDYRPQPTMRWKPVHDHAWHVGRPSSPFN